MTERNDHPVAGQIPGEDIIGCWEQFINSGKMPEGKVRPLVEVSWQRCYDYKLDPYDGRSHKVLNTNELRRAQEKSATLIKTALPLMQELYNYVAGSGFLVLLTDNRGFILELLGDQEVINNARRINFIKGALWTEEQVGTNAIGTVLQEKAPLQINSCEHYCQLHHVWTCSAAPIFDEMGKIIGVLNMSGPSSETHKHTLGMVVSAVAAIMYQMQVNAQNLELNTINWQFRNVFKTISDGVIITDIEGCITQLNPMAEMLLGVSSREAQGKLCERFFPEINWLRDTLQNGQQFSFLETSLKANTGIINCVISSNPILIENSQVNGAVVIFNPLKKLRNLVNRMSGAHASFTFQDIVGQNPILLEAVQTASLAADKRSNILLQGESGTGKELFAQAIHNASSRKNGPFVAINCGAIPRELLGSELFGYVDGAFTGAKRGGRTGKFELASGGTLFLDEIAEMPLGKQVSLLRAVQEKEITRIGDDRVIPVDVRIICATNKDLKSEVEKGNFRQDLYYRLNVIRIKLPALRERPEDIPLQFNYFLEEVSAKMEIPVPRVEPEVLDYLSRYEWPGNVRELQNVVERMINISNGREIIRENLPYEILHYNPLSNEKLPETESVLSVSKRREQQKKYKARMEKQKIIELLDKNGGNITSVAVEMDISRNTVYRKMKKYGIE
ncbi:MAG TPA: sigma-54-dependent Fis family transcriptional regulator [Syntrophomonadaceae bacterium]|nr:sigma-54-dependent Fis family transcriptional regulator [Syntrophomonadaceae bacterium]HPR94239.1 sigma-54-dependent Fis family transcriptional regulator [Syntrophomonadaceae bacterium]